MDRVGARLLLLPEHDQLVVDGVQALRGVPVRVGAALDGQLLHLQLHYLRDSHSSLCQIPCVRSSPLDLLMSHAF